MIYQAAAPRCFCGASHLLRILDADKELRESTASWLISLAIDALVEAHRRRRSLRGAVKAGARIIGVNNRNLKDFTVDVNNSVRLRALTRARGLLFVSESGIKTRRGHRQLEDKHGTDAVLIGETLMRSQRIKRRCCRS